MSSILLRMSGEDKSRIQAAAKRERSSMNAFVLRAALHAASNGHRRGPLLSPEAEAAVEALEALGQTPTEAQKMVGRALVDSPDGSTEELLRLAYRKTT